MDQCHTGGQGEDLDRPGEADYIQSRTMEARIVGGGIFVLDEPT